MSCEIFVEMPYKIDESRILWKPQPQLQKSINSLCQQMEEVEENSLEGKIAYHLFNQLRQNPNNRLLKEHWQAFLLMRMATVARKIFALLPTQVKSSVSLADLFILGIGLGIVQNPNKFLARFDETRCKLNSWYPTLKSFCDRQIKYSLFPQVREVTGCSTLGTTDLGLVARSSRRKVRDALSSCGYDETKKSQYLLIFSCFQEVKTSIELSIDKWKLEHFQQVADRYNSLFAGDFLREWIQQILKEIGESVTGEQVKQILEDIGKAIRRLLDPPSISLDSYFSGLEDEGSSLLDSMPDTSPTGEEVILKEEREEKLSSFTSRLNGCLDQLSGLKKQILFLNCGLKFKQVKTALELGIDQPKVSYELKCIKKKILDEMQMLAERKLEAENLEEIEVFLKDYCGRKIDGTLHETIRVIQKESELQFSLFKQFYFCGKAIQEFAKSTDKEEAEIKKILADIESFLSDAVIESIQDQIQVQFQQIELAKKNVSAIIADRLPSLLQR